MEVFRQIIFLGDWTTHSKWCPEEVLQFGVQLAIANLIRKLPSGYNDLFKRIIILLYILNRLFLTALVLLSGLSTFKYLKYVVNTFTKGRTMFVTSEGHIGLTTANDLEVGDSIYLLKGGKIPYILRRVNGQDSTFRLARDAYTHGHMHGREWDPKKCQPIWLI